MHKTRGDWFFVMDHCLGGMVGGLKRNELVMLKCLSILGRKDKEHEI